MSEPSAAAAAFARIAAWLAGHAPPVAAQLAPPATDAALAAANDLLARDGYDGTLLDELVAVLRVRDGSGEAGVLPGGRDFDDCPFNLLSAAGVAAERARWAANAAACPLDADDLAYAAEHSDSGVTPTDWDPAWLPFAELGGNLLCLDFHPADGGTVGQVISLNHETAGLRVLAPSLADFLQKAADAYEAGRFQLEDDEYLVAAE